MDDVLAYPRNKINNLVFSSVDDLQSSLPHYSAKDIEILRDALNLARVYKMKTKSLLIGRKIRQLRKMEAENASV